MRSRPAAAPLALVGLVGLLGLAPLAACAPEPAAWRPLPAGETWPDEAGAPIPVPAALDGLAHLDDPSAYGRDGVPTTRADAGSFGVGNGIVFGLVGLDDPVNTLTNAVGPGYQADAGFFGDSAFTLEEGGAALPVTAARVQRPRGTAFVRTWEEADGATLSTTTYAVPGEAAIVRWVTVTAAADRSLTLAWRIAGDTTDNVQARGGRRTRLACSEGAAVADGWEAPLALTAGEERTVACVQAFTDGATFPDIDAPATLAGANDDVAAMLDRALILDVPDPKVADLYEGMLVTLWTQRTASGLVSPMSRYTSGWLRDTEGPVRLWLRAGLHDEVTTTLDAVWRSQLAEGAIQNSFSLAHDLDAVALPEDPDAYWASVPFLPGRSPAEAPSYPILLHAMARDWTGQGWDDQRDAFLTACLERQQFEGGALPFSGDETFRYPMSLVVGGLPEELGHSANSTFLWRAAALALGRDPAAAPDDPYWTGEAWAPILDWEGAPLGDPYEDVALQPTWWPADLDADRVDANLATVADTLLRDDGVLLSDGPAGTPNFAYTGMVPGFWLHAVAARHRPEEAAAFAALDLVATPSGHFEELHGADHRPPAVTHAADGLGADVTARYRPWEGGDVAAALLDYLLGAHPDAAAGTLALAPHLPPGWPGFAARGLRVGDDTVDVEVLGYEEGLVVRVTGAPDLVVTVTLHGARPFTEVRADGEAEAADAAIVTARGREIVGVY